MPTVAIDLENVSVQLLCCLALKRQLQTAENISQALYSQTHRSMSHITLLGRRHLKADVRIIRKDTKRC